MHSGCGVKGLTLKSSFQNGRRETSILGIDRIEVQESGLRQEPLLNKGSKDLGITLIEEKVGLGWARGVRFKGGT